MAFSLDTINHSGWLHDAVYAFGGAALSIASGFFKGKFDTSNRLKEESFRFDRAIEKHKLLKAHKVVSAKADRFKATLNRLSNMVSDISLDVGKGILERDKFLLEELKVSLGAYREQIIEIEQHVTSEVTISVNKAYDKCVRAENSLYDLRCLNFKNNKSSISMRCKLAFLGWCARYEAKKATALIRAAFTVMRKHVNAL